MNWKTTLFGLLAGIGYGVSKIPGELFHIIGDAVTGLSLALLGLNAKDKNVTGGTKQQ